MVRLLSSIKHKMCPVNNLSCYPQMSSILIFDIEGLKTDWYLISRVDAPGMQSSISRSFSKDRLKIIMKLTITLKELSLDLYPSSHLLENLKRLTELPELLRYLHKYVPCYSGYRNRKPFNITKFYFLGIKKEKKQISQLNTLKHAKDKIWLDKR